jgi:hypothetical protein
MTSFLKYREEHHSNGRGKAHFGRSNIDGVPYRGTAIPLLKDEEFEALSERVNDGKVEIFDLSKPAERAAWEIVLDHIANNWYRVLHVDRKFSEATGSWLVYVEYMVPWTEIDPSKLHGRELTP